MLLEAARERELRYVQVSTDEVYGSIDVGTFTEESPLRPSSPYSATKTGADLLVQSYFHTYALPAVICRGSNNYGPLPVSREADPADGAQRAARRLAAGVRGRDAGAQLDPFDATSPARSGTCSSTARPGEVYNAGGPDEEANIDVVERIIELTGAQESQIEHVTDRPGHDRRYSLSSEKVRALGWRARGALRGWSRSRPSPGIARTRGGGSRSARATTASLLRAPVRARAQLSAGVSPLRECAAGGRDVL